MATGAELRERHRGSITSANRGDALRHLGLRDTIHPRDVWASLFPSQEVADAFALANLEEHGHLNLGSYATGEGVVGVCDLRNSLLGDVTDPSEPDEKGA